GPGAIVLEPQVLPRAPRVRHRRPSLSEYLDLKISADGGAAQCGEASPGAGAAGALSRLELAEALRAGQGVGRLEQSRPEGEQRGVTGRAGPGRGVERAVRRSGQSHHAGAAEVLRSEERRVGLVTRSTSRAA